MKMMETLGELSQAVLAPVADLVEPWAGSAAWGLAIVLVAVAWQLPLWRWLVRAGRGRIVRAAVLDGLAGRMEPGSDPRTERRTRVRMALEAHGLGRPSDVLLGRIRATVSIVIVVVVVVWSRTGPAADLAFAGLNDLSASPVRSGVAGVVWALVLMTAATITQVLVQRAAEVQDRRERFFATRIAPVIFGCLGLFLPGGTVVAFTAVMVLGLVTTAVAVWGFSPVTSNRSQSSEMVPQ